jgi:hypothetical protein
MSATPDSTFADSEQLVADLHRQLAECRAERDEALEQQAATAEVLQVINSSAGDPSPPARPLMRYLSRAALFSSDALGRNTPLGATAQPYGTQQE